MLFFFEKNNIIKPKMDGMNFFVVLFLKRTTLLSRKWLVWVFCYSFFEKNNIIEQKTGGMSFLFFFFEKNNIIEQKTDDMSFSFFSFEKNNIIEQKTDGMGFCYSFFEKNNIIKQINLILINKITSQWIGGKNICTAKTEWGN